MHHHDQAIASLLHLTYQCISGSKPEERDWNTYRAQFIPEARLNIVLNNENKVTVSVNTVDDYVRDATQLIGNSPFFEKDVAHRIEYKDNFALVWSDYEARKSPDGEIIYTGTNCFQMIFDGHRWKIISMLWERKARPTFFK